VCSSCATGFQPNTFHENGFSTTKTFIGLLDDIRWLLIVNRMPKFEGNNLNESTIISGFVVSV
jgi:hypothetical protein